MKQEFKLITPSMYTHMINATRSTARLYELSKIIEVNRKSGTNLDFRGYFSRHKPPENLSKYKNTTIVHGYVLNFFFKTRKYKENCIYLPVNVEDKVIEHMYGEAGWNDSGIKRFLLPTYDVSSDTIEAFGDFVTNL